MQSYFTSRLAWQEARDKCRSMGAELAKITSRQENWFVVSYMMNKLTPYDTVWLGLHRGTDKQFYWLDGSKPTFTNWGSAEPNNRGRNENCVELSHRGHSWNDVKCSHKDR